MQVPMEPLKRNGQHLRVSGPGLTYSYLGKRKPHILAAIELSAGRSWAGVSPLRPLEGQWERVLEA